MPIPTHPDLEILKYVLEVEGSEPQDIIVKGAEKIDIKIPEGSKYSITVYFHVKNRELVDLKYTQVIKKLGIVLKQRDLQIGDSFAPSTETYTKKFAEDVTPSGWATRGSFPATSTYYAGDELLYSVEWTLEITKK
ncbi:hypothetical protein CAAN1_10S01530 [[Candida] anglica]|uniref:Rho GDP dissociation inhibitor n=1 Tax=[Candida] anglica TaxID=148631 RepID=A0ABP0EIP1_9ASCO